MNVRTSQIVYRAPYVYLAKCPQGVRIGHTLRPSYEQQRMQRRYGSAELLCAVRAYAVLAGILRERFDYGCQNGQWFATDRRMIALVEQLRARDPERLITANQLGVIFLAVFPDLPYVGIARYRLSQAYLQASRYNYG